MQGREGWQDSIGAIGRAEIALEVTKSGKDANRDEMCLGTQENYESAEVANGTEPVRGRGTMEKRYHRQQELKHGPRMKLRVEISMDVGTWPPAGEVGGETSEPASEAMEVS